MIPLDCFVFRAADDSCFSTWTSLRVRARLVPPCLWRRRRAACWVRRSSFQLLQALRCLHQVQTRMLDQLFTGLQWDGNLYPFGPAGGAVVWGLVEGGVPQILCVSCVQLIFCFRLWHRNKKEVLLVPRAFRPERWRCQTAGSWFCSSQVTFSVLSELLSIHMNHLREELMFSCRAFIWITICSQTGIKKNELKGGKISDLLCFYWKTGGRVSLLFLILFWLH